MRVYRSTDLVTVESSGFGVVLVSQIHAQRDVRLGGEELLGSRIASNLLEMCIMEQCVRSCGE